GDLRVDLVSPAGQVVRLHDQVGGSADNLKRSYDTTSTSDLGDYLGQSMQGEWQLQVRDLARLDTGTLISWSITLEY
ncbi:MAG TPA: peptidase M6, partial [Desulfobulbus sp.]|nr:peptidase M6 [Desulfobulbus sp.]